jgi:hypothetical protein
MYFNDPTLYGATLPYEKEFPLRSPFVGNTPFTGLPWQNFNKFVPQAFTPWMGMGYTPPQGFTPWMGYNAPPQGFTPWMGYNAPPQGHTPWMGFNAPQFNPTVPHPYLHAGAFNPFVETGLNQPSHNYNLPIQNWTRPLPF